MKNRQWILKRRPQGAPGAADLELRETPIGPLADGEILVRNLYLSLDPTNRLWMSDRAQYLPPVGVGDVMRGGTIGVVEASRSDRFRVGDLVLPSTGGWELYSIANERGSRRIAPQAGVPLTAYLSVLGATGLTAYFGLLDICKPREGEVLAVSAAAGAVGSIVGQSAASRARKWSGLPAARKNAAGLPRRWGLIRRSTIATRMSVSRSTGCTRQVST